MKHLFSLLFLFIILIVGNQREQFAMDLSPYITMDDVGIIPDGLYFIDGYLIDIEITPNIIYGIEKSNGFNVVFLTENI